MQPHSAPGIYARAFLEGFLDEADLALFCQKITARAQGRRGLLSYPHPWLMPDFWQFPTGSMGIGPINAIYQARFMRYLEHRGLAAPSERRVWGIFGDGEMDEPESIAALTLAAREKLDNLVFVINCNLQHQDGASHLIASTVPNCRAYDPAYAYEAAVIIAAGMRRMLTEQCDEFYYLTVTNENLPQPDMPSASAWTSGTTLPGSTEAITASEPHCIATARAQARLRAFC